jgi:hydroxymethylbilane synthase
MTKLTIATRGSALALWQARHVAERLGGETELCVIKTKGDKILDVPLAKIGGKGLFVKEIEEALTDRRADLAVHSMKDVPAELAEGLTLAAISAREDPRDALVSRGDVDLASLQEGARVGTSSVRRMCLLRALRPDLEIVQLRGNVDTRLRKLDAAEFDAILLACAGLERLGHAGRIAERLDPATFVPAVGQGILGIEARADDEVAIAAIRRAIHDETAATALALERAFLARLGGGCQTPLACHAVVEGDRVSADGLVGSVSGTEILRDRIDGLRSEAAALGVRLAEALLERGAGSLLAVDP